MIKSPFDCFVTQRKVLQKNTPRLLDYCAKIAREFDQLKKEYDFEHLFIVNHESKFFQSVSLVDKKENWTSLDQFEENFSDNLAFGLWDIEDENLNHPIPDFLSLETGIQLNHIFTLWLLETAQQSDLKNIEQAIFYSSDGHFENIWNLKTWAGPVDIDDIKTIK